MATLAVVDAEIGGTVYALAAASAGGDLVPNDGKTLLHVKNGGVGSINVTLHEADACDQGTVHTHVVAVAAGVEKVFGPFPTYFNNDNHQVAVTYSGVVTVTVAAVRT